MVNLTKEGPKVLLFDIGGVCVVSPMQAILDYEKANNIPIGWINHSIAFPRANGAWQALEKGEAKLDAAWFQLFEKDLTDESLWKRYYETYSKKSLTGIDREAVDRAVLSIPPVPKINAERLFWSMMEAAREPDPYMYPALKRLRRYADEHKGTLVLAALSNTSIFPEGHPFNEETTRVADVKRQFDVFVSSAHVGLRKPDATIYYYTVGRVAEFVIQKGYGAGVKAEDFTFLDDIGTNLRTARAVGMNTIKVDLGRADKAVRELEAITGMRLTQDGSTKL